MIYIPLTVLNECWWLSMYIFLYLHIDFLAKLSIGVTPARGAIMVVYLLSTCQSYKSCTAKRSTVVYTMAMITSIHVSVLLLSTEGHFNVLPLCVLSPSSTNVDIYFQLRVLYVVTGLDVKITNDTIHISWIQYRTCIKLQRCIVY